MNICIFLLEKDLKHIHCFNLPKKYGMLKLKIACISIWNIPSKHMIEFEFLIDYSNKENAELAIVFLNCFM